MTIYVHWTCININKKDVHARMISMIEKICIRNTATMFFLKIPSLVIIYHRYIYKEPAAGKG